jgi:hypothetical protein
MGNVDSSPKAINPRLGQRGKIEIFEVNRRKTYLSTTEELQPRAKWMTTMTMMNPARNSR